MIKVSTFLAESEFGLAAVPLFGPADAAFEKTAATGLLPEVLQYIESLRPRNDAQYVLVNAMGAGEYYGCFPVGTLVETEDGEVPIEAVGPGSKVLTHRNRFRKVLDRLPREADELCDLYIQGLPGNLPALTATPNHELWVVTRDDFLRTKRRVVWKGDISTHLNDRREQALKEMEFSWVSISDLRAGDYIAEPFPLEEDPAALGDEKWNCQAAAYLMGLYAAEGCVAYRYGETVYKKLRNGSFETPISKLVYIISATETDVVRQAKESAAKYERLVTITEKNDTHSIRMELSFQELGELCLDHIGSGALEKKLSSALLRMPRVWQQTFFDAYAAGDGCVCGAGKEEDAIRCVSASPALLRGFRLLLARLGLAGSINGRHNKKATWYSGKPIYNLSISGGQLRGRGTPKSYIHPGGYILSSVKKIEQYNWQGEVFDLMVEEDSSFTASGIAVHNSNINADHFPETALIHKPDDWTGNPLIDRSLSKGWPYGFPTFYNAYPFAHHRNKDPSRAYGEVEMATWNDHMKRVELVVRCDKLKCQQFGGVGVWDKLKAGQFPDVSMGCCPAGTRVTMSDGSFRNIECVKENDAVLTHRGVPGRVNQLMRYRYEGVSYRFKAYGFLRELTLTANHPLWLVRAEQLRCAPTSTSERGWGKPLVPRQRHCTPFVRSASAGCSTCATVPSYRFEWTRADQAEVGDYLAFPVPEQIDGAITDAVEARLLGYYLAEGHVSNYNDRPLEQITFSLNFNEKELAEEIEDLGRSLGVQVAWHSEAPERGARYVTLVSKALADRCLRFCGSGATTKQLSKEVLYMAPGLQLAFLGAYLDGDGGTYKGSAYFSTASEQLAQQVFIVLARCGLIASINELLHHPSEKSLVRRDTTEYQVWVGTDFSSALAPYTRKPVRASKKVRGQRFFYTHEGVRYLMAPIEEIVEEDYDDDVFNFSVEGDDSYIAERLAVHNSKVPYDTCSITLDWDTYKKALSTFNPRVYRHPGMAVLEFHKKLKKKNGVGIRGVSVTRNDYSEYMRKMPNRILPDGRKVFVWNDFPRFFDISFVFIGADKTAKVMIFIKRSGYLQAMPSALTAEKMGLRDSDIQEPGVKTSSVSDHILERAFLKGAEEKKSEIDKDVVPSQFAGKAIPLLTKDEPDIPDEMLKALSTVPVKNALATTSGLGMLLRPREFERTLALRGMREKTLEGTDYGDMSADDFMPALARVLMPMMSQRSALAPYIERRIIIISERPRAEVPGASSLSSDSLRKMGAAYNGYRRGVMNVVASSQNLIRSAALSNEAELHKLASAEAEELFTPLTFKYLDEAFHDELPLPLDTAKVVVKTSSRAKAGVERGFPSRNT